MNPTPSFAHADADIAQRLAAAGVSTLGGSGARCLEPRFRSITGLPLVGRAYPVQCAAADNLAIHVALLHAPAGAVLVINAAAVPNRGYWGAVLTEAARQRGITGVVVDGSVRDVAEMVARGFPVYATGIAAAGTTKERGGEVGAPTLLGEVEVSGGDWVVGDADGVGVVPMAQEADIIDRAAKKVEWELAAMRQIRTGTTTVALFGLDVTRVTTHPGS